MPHTNGELHLRSALIDQEILFLIGFIPLLEVDEILMILSRKNVIIIQRHSIKLIKI